MRYIRQNPFTVDMYEYSYKYKYIFKTQLWPPVRVAHVTPQTVSDVRSSRRPSVAH